MIKKISASMFVLLLAITLAQQSLNGKMKEIFTFDYGDHKEYIDFTFNGVVYSYHHYFFTDNSELSRPDVMIFNQDVSGFLLRFGNYYFMIPLKKRCYLGCEVGLSLIDISLIDVFYINKINSRNAVLLLPDRGVAAISTCKHRLSSMLLSHGGLSATLSPSSIGRR